MSASALFGVVLKNSRCKRLIGYESASGLTLRWEAGSMLNALEAILRWHGPYESRNG